MSDKLTYRLFERDDIEGVLRLWEEESGWGGITEEQFYKWYVNTPFGDCLTVVALNQAKQIVGQTVFMPSRIFVNGSERKALRFLAPILSKKFSQRIGKTGHPTIEMFKFAIKVAVQSGYSITYALPARAWLRLADFFVVPEVNEIIGDTTSPTAYSLSLKSFSNSSYFSQDQLNVSVINEFGQDFNDLWDSAKKSFPIKCGIVRDSQWLQWKLGGRLGLAIRNSANSLIGYVAIDKKNSLIVDALARTPQELEIVIGSSLQTLNNLQEFNLTEVKLMQTAIMQDVIEKFGFTKIDFKFAFWCYSLDKSISKEMISPSHWYLMPND